LPDLSAESQEKLILAKEGRVGLWSRVAGDVLDIATVLSLAKSDGADRDGFPQGADRARGAARERAAG
jgi:hypothetical protein